MFNEKHVLDRMYLLTRILHRILSVWRRVKQRSACPLFYHVFDHILEGNPAWFSVIWCANSLLGVKKETRERDREREKQDNSLITGSYYSGTLYTCMSYMSDVSFKFEIILQNPLLSHTESFSSTINSSTLLPATHPPHNLFFTNICVHCKY